MMTWKPINKFSVLLLAAALLASCSPNQRIVESNAQSSNAEIDRANRTPVQTSIEQEIESMRTADFIFIYVVKRKDGGELDQEDRRFASSVIPGQMNRRTVSSDGSAILIGSNFRLPQDARKLIEERFTLSDLSRDPEAQNSSRPAPSR